MHVIRIPNRKRDIISYNFVGANLVFALYRADTRSAPTSAFYPCFEMRIVLIKKLRVVYPQFFRWYPIKEKKMNRNFIPTPSLPTNCCHASIYNHRHQHNILPLSRDRKRTIPARTVFFAQFECLLTLPRLKPEDSWFNARRWLNIQTYMNSPSVDSRASHGIYHFYEIYVLG